MVEYDQFEPEIKVLPQMEFYEKLENPYTVENMQIAYKKLEEENLADPSITIKITDYYVRFLPKDSLELNRLEADSLFLFDYPLDYAIDRAIDLDKRLEEIPIEQKWYYTSVPVDYEFSDVKYEKLADLYLPPEDKIADEGDTKTEQRKFFDMLEDKALLITGNQEGPTTKRSSKERPQGYVKVYDTNKKIYVGVEKVRVRTRRWFKYGYDYTDASGYYSVNRRYRHSVHYCVFFKNEIGFKIRAGMLSLWKAKHHVGKHDKNGYDINIGTGSRAWRFATLNNAVVKYWQLCDKFGVQKPHSNLRLVAQNDTKGMGAAPMLKHNWGVYGFTSKSAVSNFLWKLGLIGKSYLANTFFKFVLPDIIVDIHPDKGTDRAFLLTFHELSHASHFKKVGSRYWTKYINYIVTYGSFGASSPYGSGTGENSGYCGVGEMWANFCADYFYRDCYGELESPNWNPHKYFYDPGFLMDAVNDIPDLSIQEVSSSLTSSVISIPKLKDKLKNYTDYDDQIDRIYNKYDLP